MMKKVLYGVALALLASVSVGSLQSCKDDVNDLATQTSYDLTKLRSQLDSEAARLEGLISAEAAARQADIATVNRLISDLEGKHDRDIARIDGAISQLDGKVDALSAKVDGLYTNEYLDGKFQAIQGEIDALKAFAESVPGQLEEIWMKTEELAEWMTQLNNLINDNAASIEELGEMLEETNKKIDDLIKQLDQRVTGILIQGVYSPAFGDFRTPLGIKSNILFNWYGKNVWDKEIKFPSNEEAFSATGKPGLDNLNDLDPTLPFTVPAGYYGDYGIENSVVGDAVTLGKVYVTLNPANVVRDNVVITIEDSKGNVLPVEAVNLVPSDYQLMHGYTRSVENGFYEGDVVMKLDEANIEAVGVELEEGLKTSLKDAFKDPSTSTAKALVKAVFDQLQNTGLAAYALRYDWNEEGLGDTMDPTFSMKSFAVLSQYDIAAATALPLSYNTFKGYAGEAKLPEFGHIQNLIQKIKDSGALKFELSDITVDGINIDFKDLEVAVNGDDLTITIPDVMVEGEDGKPVATTLVLSTAFEEQKSENGVTEIPINGLNGENGIYAAIEKGIKDALNKAGAQISSEIQSQLQAQINSVIEKLNDQVSGKINDLLNSAENKLEPYFGKINKAIDLYNKIANKINNFLKNPNAYLQVAAYYKMGNDYGIVSGKLNDPTPFVAAGGDAFKLYLSSYTGELIVPACKKYVAISGVYKNGAKVNANLSDLNFDASTDLNITLDGNKSEVEVNASKLSAGNVYEVTYQALDYRGYTSTKKFYIEVK